MLIGFPPLSRFSGRATRRPQGVRIVPVGPATRPAIERLLVEEPVRGVHVAARLQEGVPVQGPSVFAIVCGEGRVLGAVSAVRGFAWLLSPEVRTDADVHFALATFIAGRGCEQDVLVGPEDEVAGVLEALEIRDITASEVRAQRMMATAGAGRAPDPAGEFFLRGARMADLRWLLDAHGAMCLEDLGVDQVARNRRGYEAYFRELVAGGRVYVGETAGEPVFKAEIALRTSRAWLVEGVYTVPSARGRGFARHAMARISIDAAARGCLTCLYVHRENRTAIGVYRAVGFEDVCPWTTAVIGRQPARGRWFGRRHGLS